MSYRSIGVATLALWLGVSSMAMAAPPTVRIATDAPYKPMEFRQANGELVGFDIDLGDAICRRAGLDCHWVVQSWDGIIAGLMARKYDAIMSTMAITPARRRRLRFAGPYIRLGSAWFIPKTTDIATPDAATLADKRIGVQRGTIQDRYVTDHYGDTATVKRYRTTDDMAVDLEVGRLDAMLVTRVVGRRMLAARHRVGDFHVMAPKPPLGQDLGIAFRPGDKALTARFDRALEALRADGTYARLHARWFGGPDDAADGA